MILHIRKHHLCFVPGLWLKVVISYIKNKASMTPLCIFLLQIMLKALQKYEKYFRWAKLLLKKFMEWYNLKSSDSGHPASRGWKIVQLFPTTPGVYPQSQKKCWQSSAPHSNTATQPASLVPRFPPPVCWVPDSIYASMTVLAFGISLAVYIYSKHINSSLMVIVPFFAIFVNINIIFDSWHDEKGCYFLRGFSTASGYITLKAIS